MVQRLPDGTPVRWGGIEPMEPSVGDPHAFELSHDTWRLSEGAPAPQVVADADLEQAIAVDMRRNALERIAAERARLGMSPTDENDKPGPSEALAAHSLAGGLTGAADLLTSAYPDPDQKDNPP